MKPNLLLTRRKLLERLRRRFQKADVKIDDAVLRVVLEEAIDSLSTTPDPERVWFFRQRREAGPEDVDRLLNALRRRQMAERACVQTVVIATRRTPHLSAAHWAALRAHRARAVELNDLSTIEAIDRVFEAMGKKI